MTCKRVLFSRQNYYGALEERMTILPEKNPTDTMFMLRFFCLRLADFPVVTVPNCGKDRFQLRNEE